MKEAVQAGVEACMCAHCGLPVPGGLVRDDRDAQFCCHGCETVYALLHEAGLAGYYRMREATDGASTARPVELAGHSFEALDHEAFAAAHVRPLPDGVMRCELALEGVHCAACVWLVERLPRLCDGVLESRLRLTDGIAAVVWDPTQVKLSQVATKLNQLGYRPHPARGDTAALLRRKEDRGWLIRLGIAGACTGNVMLLSIALYAGAFSGMEEGFWRLFRWVSMGLAAVSLLGPGNVFFTSAWRALRARAVNLDVPIALALLAGGCAGVVNVLLDMGDVYFDSLTMLVFLLLTGRVLQRMQQRRAVDAVKLAGVLLPAQARRVVGGMGGLGGAGRAAEAASASVAASASGGQSELVPIEALGVGDVLEVWPGEVLAADAEVVRGGSHVDRSVLSGESEPVAVAVGEPVHAGEANAGGGTLWCRVVAVGQDSRLGRLMSLIEEGVASKSGVVRFADRIAGVFTMVLVALSAMVFAGWWYASGLEKGVDQAVALLIVACPCALGLATPLSMAVAMGRAARGGVLIKRAEVLELLARRRGVRRVWLDKTGTITQGAMRIVSRMGDEGVWPTVAAIEARSLHPVGRALSMGERDEAQLHEVCERPGGIEAQADGRRWLIGSMRFAAERGVLWCDTLAAQREQHEQAGHTSVVVAIDRQAVALAALGDEPRSDSAAAIEALRQQGWRVGVLSGDAPGVVGKVAQRVGLRAGEALGGVSPERKLRVIREGIDGSGVTVMIGDGVNDAAALAAADVGVAVHGGAEVSLSAADVYITRPGLSPVVDLLSISRRTMGTIRRNFAVSLGYNVTAVGLAAAGVITPLLAAILMPLSSLTVLTLATWSLRASRTRAAQLQREAGEAPR